MTDNTKGLIGLAALIIGVGILAYGWINNIISLLATNEPIGWLVARAIGVFMVPLGAVLGYL